MGERQMYASPLKSLVDESNIEFPVFIDSPAKFDRDHAENVIKEFYQMFRVSGIFP